MKKMFFRFALLALTLTVLSIPFSFAQGAPAEHSLGTALPAGVIPKVSNCPAPPSRPLRGTSAASNGKSANGRTVSPNTGETAWVTDIIYYPAYNCLAVGFVVPPYVNTSMAVTLNGTTYTDFAANCGGSDGRDTCGYVPVVPGETSASAQVVWTWCDTSIGNQCVHFTTVTSPVFTKVLPIPTPTTIAQQRCLPCVVGSPIDVATGELSYDKVDAALSGPFGLTFARHYSNQYSGSGDLGNNWTFTYGAHLDLSAASAGMEGYIDDKDIREDFIGLGGAPPTANLTTGDTLIPQSNGQWILQAYHGEASTFDVNGRLIQLADRNHNAQTISRDASGHILSVTDGELKQLLFTYNGSHVTQVVSSPAGISIALAYGAPCPAGNLCSVTESDGMKWHYAYTDTVTTNLTSVTDPLGHVTEANSYSGLQVTQQIVGTSKKVLVFQYTFYLGQGLTNVTDGLNDGWITQYFYDANSLLVTQIVGPLCHCGGDTSRTFDYGQLQVPSEVSSDFQRLLGITDGNGHTTRFKYNDVMQLNSDGTTAIVTPRPSISEIDQPLTSSVTRVTQFQYNGPFTDLPTTIIAPSVGGIGTGQTVSTATLTYDVSGNLKQVDSQGYVSGVSQTRTSKFDYDVRGRTTKMTGPRTDITPPFTTLGYYHDDATELDPYRRGQLKSITDAVGHIWTYAAAVAPGNTYSVYGAPTGVTDPNTVSATYSYDPLGRTLSQTLTAASSPTIVLSAAYDSAGRLTTVVRPLGNQVQFSYDDADRMTAITLADAAAHQQDKLTYGYDVKNQVTQRSTFKCTAPATTCASWSAAKTSDTFGYDAFSRISLVTHADSNKIGYGYDGAGNIQTIADENHYPTANTTYGYDFANRVVSISQKLGTGLALTAIGYDQQDNVVADSDPNNNQSTFVYDDFGGLSKATSPVTGVSQWTRDNDNDPIAFTDANGATTTVTFDPLDRTLQTTSARSGSATEVLSRLYDDTTAGHFGIGRLASMTDATGSVVYRYEMRGLLVTEARTINNLPHNFSYGYDANGNRNAITYPDSNAVTYVYDYSDRPYSVSKGSSTMVSSAIYAPFGPMTQLSYGNGIVQKLTRDNRYRPLENKLLNASGGTIADYTYLEDATGNVTQIHDAISATYNRDFQYDDLNRLTTANAGSALWGTASGNGYSYDAMGNMTALQLGATRTATFNYAGTLPELSSVKQNGVTSPVSYDAAGNEITVGTKTYGYTPRNFLQSADGFTYTYDGWGRRAISSSATASRYSFYGPDNTLLEETALVAGPLSIPHRQTLGSPDAQGGPGSPTRPSRLTPRKNSTAAPIYDYVYFGGMPIAQIATTVSYDVDDHLGTPLMQVDAITGATTWRAEYEPYGSVYALRGGDVHQPLRLPGQVAQQFDTGANGASDLEYNVARWYRPSWGRYNQADPLGDALGVNRYSYAGENPTGGIDPLGLCVIFVEFNWIIPGVDHSFILTLDNIGGSGATVFRAGPILQPNLYNDDMWGLYAQSYSWKATIPGLQGNDWATHWNQNLPEHEKEVRKDFLPCACVDAKFRLLIDRVNGAGVPYRLGGPNSNSFVDFLLSSIGINFQPPFYNFAPGWGTPLVRGN